MRWWMCVMENEGKKKIVSEEVLKNKLRVQERMDKMYEKRRENKEEEEEEEEKKKRERC